MNKSFPFYQDLCTRYYELDKPIIPADEWALYYSYAQELSGTILEPMCGTGRLMLPLLKAGFTVEGFDASPSMLAVLRKKAADEKLHLTAWQGLLQELSVTEKYSGIMIPISSFNLITNWDDISKSLKALYASLRPGGIFVAELLLDTLADSVVTETPIVSEVVDGKGTKISLKTVYHPLVDGVAQADCDYTLVKNGQAIVCEQEKYQLRFYTKKQIELLWKEAGFSRILFWKAFGRGENPDERDYMVIVEATK